ncbi:UNVERIFIED_CONTAM: hypothetical protein H355_007134 [Colinus virginianus]|nr:hypothetical protein H355_007134 [Colinus virginianus]
MAGATAASAGDLKPIFTTDFFNAFTLCIKSLKTGLSTSDQISDLFLFPPFFFPSAQYQISDNRVVFSNDLGTFCSAGVLRILTEMFLPHISLADLEQTFFSKVLPKTLQLYDKLMYELSSKAKGLTGQNTELCSTVRNLLQASPLCLCLTFCELFDYFTDSESVYCGHLHLISDLLQAVFKETYSLQKQLMELFDQISVGSASSQDDVTDMVSAVAVVSFLVIHTVLEICSVISNMDHALHANTWKFIIKYVFKLLDFIADGTDLRLFQKTVKLCRFFANSLVYYTKEFLSFLSDLCSLLHQLFLQIYSKFPPSLYAPAISEVHQDEISRVFLVALDPLISQLLPFSPFMEQVLGDSSEVISTGQPAVPITLYHYVCVHLCSFIASTLPSQFPHLEYALLDAVLGSSMITSLLAMDSWCFLARYGSAELCAHHSTVIAHLIKSQPDECYQLSVLGVLLKRMLFLMAPDHQASVAPAFLSSCLQVEFACRFLPEEVENLAVWQHVSLRALNADLGKRVARELCVAGLAQCRRWLSSRRAWGELQPVNVAFSVMLVACSFSGDALEAELQASILGVLGQFWTFLQAKQVRRFHVLTAVSDEPRLQQTLCLLLHLLEFFIQALDAQLMSQVQWLDRAALTCALFAGLCFLQVFALLSSLLRLDPPDHVRLAVLDFLSSVGKVFIPQEVQETVHEDVVPQCLNSEEIKNKVVDFMAKVRQGGETTEARIERLKQERIICGAHFMKMAGELEPPGEVCVPL